MDQKTRIDFPLLDPVHDLIEWDDDNLGITQTKPHRKVGRSHQSGHAYSSVTKVGYAHLATRHYHRTVIIAYRRTRCKKRVLVEHIRICVNRHCRHIEFRIHGALIQRLDVLYDVLESQSLTIDLSCRKTVEHERVVRVRAMAERYFSCLHSLIQISLANIPVRFFV